MCDYTLRLFLLFLLLSVGLLKGKDLSGDGCSFTCGLNATYILLNKTGHHAAYSDLARDFERQNPPDSLLAIKTVLYEHSCETVGIQAAADYFLNKTGPAIVWMQLTSSKITRENHFSILVAARRQNGVELLDPVFDLTSPSYISWDSFSRIYKGTALILK